MLNFKEFLSNQNSETIPLWKASKPEILKLWNSLPSNTPIFIKPIEYGHEGSTYGEDGIRITGSSHFIGSVLSKLKPLLNYENNSTKLSVTYRQTKSPSQALEGNNKLSYVFYVSAQQRGSNNDSI